MHKTKQILLLASLASLLVTCDKEKAPSPETPAEAAAPKPTECEQVYEKSSAAWAKTLTAPPGASAKPSPLPPREKFLAICEKLPALSQKCLQSGYQRANREQCNNANLALDPVLGRDLIDLLHSHMKKAPPAPPAKPAGSAQPAKPAQPAQPAG